MSDLQVLVNSNPCKVKQNGYNEVITKMIQNIYGCGKRSKKTKKNKHVSNGVKKEIR